MPLLCNIFNHFFKIVACSLKNLLIHPTSQFITRFIKANSLSQTMESTDSSTGSQQPNLPPGFRFHPTDEELVVHYLKRKASSAPLPVAIIAEVDLYKFDPWELPAKATFGDQEWYFFSPRDRKYPNGARPNRAATSGYWKATGTDKPVLTDKTQKVGVKKALVFYRGKPPKGIKTNWIMHEYRLADNKVSNKPPGCDLGNKKNSLRLDDWVLCRIYKKHNTHRPMDHDKDDSVEDMLESIPSSISVGSSQQHGGLPLGPRINFGALLENEQNLFEGMLNSAASDHHHHHHHHHHHGIRSSTNSFSHLVSSSSNKSEQQLPMLPLKRTLPSLYWTDDGADGGAGPSSSSKRFEGDEQHQDHNGNSSMATLFSQLPQTPPLHQQSILGSLGDGIFRPHNYQLPGMNWYT